VLVEHRQLSQLDFIATEQMVVIIGQVVIAIVVLVVVIVIALVQTLLASHLLASLGLA
jgi:hypothetical protein